MKDKITRLAKGITELETPQPVFIPETICGSLNANVKDSFTVEIQSMNGYSVKGVCFSDELRVQPEKMTFAGRKTEVGFNIDTAGLSYGDKLSGTLVFITNAGEKKLNYEFNIEAADKNGIDGQSDFDKFVQSPVIYAVSAKTRDITYEHRKKPEFPKKDSELEALASELIRAKDESERAFYIYGEAIKRGLSITRLYESYMAAYPDDCGEAIPREVLMYFSYEREIPYDTAEKLYADVILNEPFDSGLIDEFAPGMSAFAMNSSMSGRINKRLEAIYDRMIFSGMIDKKAASVLPDILMCREIKLTEGSADYAAVSYNEIKTSFKSRMINGITYIPVYFDDAHISFYYERNNIDEDGNAESIYTDVSDKVRYTERKIFDKPELLEKCFELCPEHPMLLLSVCRKLLREGVKDKKDGSILKRALEEDSYSEAFRKKAITVLCRAGGDMSWIGALTDSDYDRNVCGGMISAYVKAGDFDRAFGIMSRFGAEAADISDIKKTADGIIKKNDAAVMSDTVFIKLCRLLFEKKKASDGAVELLCRYYYGSISDMLHVMKAAKKRELRLYDLPEKILSFELFSERDDDIDETVRTYIDGRNYDDLLIRAYLCVRSADYFLYEKNISEYIFFDILEGYMSSADNPFLMPEICSIALTAYYSGQETLSGQQKALCQKLTDRLIEEGLVFRYTKMLRKKISIPEEICWKYFVEYRAQTDMIPRLLVKILPDDAEYRQADMRRVYRNVFVMSTVLFIGDEMHYLIYDNALEKEPAEEGVINVTKLHRQGNDRMRYINLMMKALDAEDEEALRESMLNYVENSETVRELFKLES